MSDYFGCTASRFDDTEPLTMEKLLEAIETMPPCPFAKTMKDNGGDPNDGWVLMLPLTLCKPHEIDTLPSYVRVSRLIDKPVMIKPDVFPNIKMEL